MQDSPDIDVVGSLGVVDHVRVASDRQRAQARQIQFVGVARPPGGRVARKEVIGLFQGVDEAERSRLCIVAR